ncbi:hypothetical protein Pcinc_044059 [Petrolisthes cinctipes]|uniref:Uncharacterized protein n=1 Tax=Petrolisthes cinctipes TaxID=88211 RepID=A0AAE1BGJ8_PETCI|nr:hypothetical protein Pcinc_044059 [Petrolisthes cinctipes]
MRPSVSTLLPPLTPPPTLTTRFSSISFPHPSSPHHHAILFHLPPLHPSSPRDSLPSPSPSPLSLRDSLPSPSLLPSSPRYSLPSPSPSPLLTTRFSSFSLPSSLIPCSPRDSLPSPSPHPSSPPHHAILFHLPSSSLIPSSPRDSLPSPFPHPSSPPHHAILFLLPPLIPHPLLTTRFSSISFSSLCFPLHIPFLTAPSPCLPFALPFPSPLTRFLFPRVFLGLLLHPRPVNPLLLPLLGPLLSFSHHPNITLSLSTLIHRHFFFLTPFRKR